MTHPVTTTPVGSNVFEKLQQVRVALSKIKLKKSGRNAFAKYDYFELADFLPTITDLMGEAKLCSTISFGLTCAVLCVINSEDPKEKIVFTSPMANATIKGCNEVQNLGGTQTYIRRYLYMTAFEITESDASDSTSTEPEEPIAAAQKQSVTKERQTVTNSSEDDLKCPNCRSKLLPSNNPDRKTGEEYYYCAGYKEKNCKYTYYPTRAKMATSSQEEPPSYVDEDVPFQDVI